MRAEVEPVLAGVTLVQVAVVASLDGLSLDYFKKKSSGETAQFTLHS